MLRRPILFFGSAILCGILTWLLCGCAGTVIESNVAGSAQPLDKVGFIRKVWLNGVCIGAWFTSEGRDTYNWELSQHGAELHPPRGKDFGVTQHVGDEYFLNREAIDDWGSMATWSRSGEHPKKTILQKATGL